MSSAVQADIFTASSALHLNSVGRKERSQRRDNSRILPSDWGQSKSTWRSDIASASRRGVGGRSREALNPKLFLSWRRIRCVEQLMATKRLHPRVSALRALGFSFHKKIIYTKPCFPSALRRLAFNNFPNGVSIPTPKQIWQWSTHEGCNVICDEKGLDFVCWGLNVVGLHGSGFQP